jgi:hypothetical protein
MKGHAKIFSEIENGYMTFLFTTNIKRSVDKKIVKDII